MVMYRIRYICLKKITCNAEVMRYIFSVLIPIFIFTVLFCTGCERKDEPEPPVDENVYDTLYIDKTRLTCYHMFNGYEYPTAWEMWFAVTDKDSIVMTWTCFWITKPTEIALIPAKLYRIPSNWNYMYNRNSSDDMMLVLPVDEYGFYSVEDEGQAKGGTVDIRKENDDTYTVEFKLKFATDKYYYCIFHGDINTVRYD